MSDLIVERVRTQDGSHIEPPLDEHWDDLRKLQWHAAVTEHDTGIRIRVREGGLQRKVRGRWKAVPGMYSVNVGGTSCSAYDFNETWIFLNGVSNGAREAIGHD